MNPKRKRKLLLVLALVVGVGMAIGLAMYAMRQDRKSTRLNSSHQI